MTFKSPTPPLCRGCGKAIAKHTESIYFGRLAQLGSHPGFSIERPKTIAEAQRLVNTKIISNTRNRVYDGNGKSKPEEDYIDHVSVWDGESYTDEFFHSQQCAADLGRAMARQGWALAPYNNIMNASTPA